jgi:hypothetical protein
MLIFTQYLLQVLLKIDILTSSILINPIFFNLSIIQIIGFDKYIKKISILALIFLIN